MIRALSIILLLALSLTLNAKAFTTIKGTVNGAHGYDIRLLTYSDQITFLEKKLATAKIDAKGNFNLIVELQTTTYAFFAIGNIRADIILEAGRAYEIRFADYPSLSYIETRNLILQNESLGYEIIHQSDNDINKIVVDGAVMYNNFLAEHFMDLYLKRQDVVSRFVDTFFLKYGSQQHPWIQLMVDYKIAILKLSGYHITMEQAWKLWLHNRDIEYHHPDFMEFFNQLFSNYLTTRQKHYTYNELKNIINEKGSYFFLSEMMGRDTILRNEQLRELVMIKSLGEIYHNKDFYNSSVVKILNHIAASSKFREHRMIASNLLFLNTRFDKGMMAPDFEFPGLDGETHSLSRYRGKYVYLAFFASNCVPCLAEFQLLTAIYPQLNSSLEIVAISLDPDPERFRKTMEQQSYPWPVVHFNNDFELTTRFDIRNYPFFILIAPDGSYHTYSARQPSAQFKLWFEEAVIKQK